MSNFVINQAKLIGEIDKILIKRSLAYRVSDIQPLKGPVGIITGARWDKDTKKLIIEKADVTAESIKIDTDYTNESLQDLESIYKENFYEILSHYLVDELMYRIDEKFISMLKERASDKGTYVFKGEDYNNSLWSVGQAISIRVNKGLADLAISDNRSPLGWAIVSSNIASLLGGTLNDTNASDNLDDDSPSYLGRIGGVDYYIDYTHPNNSIDNVIFGIKGNGITKGSTILSPYTRTWIDTVDNSTGERRYFLLDRTAISMNPLDNPYWNNGNGQSEFVGKISFDLSDLTIMK